MFPCCCVRTCEQTCLQVSLSEVDYSPEGATDVVSLLTKWPQFLNPGGYLGQPNLWSEYEGIGNPEIGCTWHWKSLECHELLYFAQTAKPHGESETWRLRLGVSESQWRFTYLPDSVYGPTWGFTWPGRANVIFDVDLETEDFQEAHAFVRSGAPIQVEYLREHRSSSPSGAWGEAVDPAEDDPIVYPRYDVAAATLTAKALPSCANVDIPGFPALGPETECNLYIVIVEFEDVRAGDYPDPLTLVCLPRPAPSQWPHPPIPNACRGFVFASAEEKSFVCGSEPYWVQAHYVKIDGVAGWHVMVSQDGTQPTSNYNLVNSGFAAGPPIVDDLSVPRWWPPNHEGDPEDDAWLSSIREYRPPGYVWYNPCYTDRDEHYGGGGLKISTVCLHDLPYAAAPLAGKPAIAAEATHDFTLAAASLNGRSDLAAEATHDFTLAAASLNGRSDLAAVAVNGATTATAALMAKSDLGAAASDTEPE